MLDKLILEFLFLNGLDLTFPLEFFLEFVIFSSFFSFSIFKLVIIKSIECFEFLFLS